MERLKNIINLLIILCIGASIFILVSGGGRFEIYGLRISITSLKNPLRWLVILLFLKHIIVDKEGILLKILNRKLDSIGNLFNLKKIYEGGILEKNFLLLNTIFLCIIAGIVLLIGDSIKCSDDLFYKFIISSTLPLDYYTRLFFIIKSVLFYGLVGLITAYLLKLVSSSLMSSRLRPYLGKKIFLLQFDAVLLAAIFIITSSFTGFKLLGIYSQTDFQRSDVLLASIALFILFLIVPLLLQSRQYSKIVALVIVTAFIPLSYIYAGYRESNETKAIRRTNYSNVILITIDTARADHFTMYGYHRDTTLNLNIIAKEGALFTRAYCQMSTTDPSHTSILTGVYPRTHGLLKNGMRISNKKIPFLTKWFKKKGYITAAISSRALLNPETMGLKGFDYISVPNHKVRKVKSGKFYAVTGDITYGRAIKWIDEYGGKPFFLWVHFWDPHGEYDPPAPYNSKFNSGYKGVIETPRHLPGDPFTEFMRPEDKFTPQEIEYITSLYDGEIAFADEYVFKLIRYIEEKTSKENGNPFFIIMSDHGETLDEIQDRFNYAFNHSEMVRYGQMHVPLILKCKGVIPEGKIIDGIVESVDIAPTIVELLDKNGKYKCNGKSFAEFISNENWKGKETAYAERRIFDKKILKFLNVPEYAVITENWYLIFNEVREIELYDISNDPLEQRDLAKERKDVVDMLLAKLESWKKAFPMTPYKPEKISKEKTEVLKSLGYIQ